MISRPLSGRKIYSLFFSQNSIPSHIKNYFHWAWDLIKDPVRMIFHNSLALGITPEPWHHTTGCIIPKPLKSDYTNPRAFRIISLTSSFQKLLVRLILWHLELDPKYQLNSPKTNMDSGKVNQRNQRFTYLPAWIEDAMATGHYALGVFLDIEQAFDAVSFTATREALLEANIPLL